MTISGQPKPFAALSSTLLARKGHARPAMRPQGFGGFGAIPGSHDDLGWDDMGFTEDEPSERRYVQPVAVPPVLRQREALRTEFDEGASSAPLNGTPLNGAPLNGASHHGMPAGGSTLNGAPLNGTPLNGAAHNGTALNGTPLNGAALNGTTPSGSPMPGAASPAAEGEGIPSVAALPAPASEPAPQRVTISIATAARIERETAAKRSKAAFTLRLDHDRHLRLRLATAIRNISAQALVTEALDAFLRAQTEVEELVRQIPSRKS